MTDLSGGRLQWFSTVQGPCSIGWPAAGRRVWATCAAAGGKLVYPMNPFTDANLLACIYRKVAGSPCMWMWASAGRVNAYLDFINSSRDKLPPHPRGKRFRAEDYVGSAYASRLYMHQCNGARVRTQDPTLTDTEFVFDISQNVTWARRPSGIFPRPLKASCMWSESASRPFLPEEVLAAQGIS